jgi:hypothetical protein
MLRELKGLLARGEIAAADGLIEVMHGKYPDSGFQDGISRVSYLSRLCGPEEAVAEIGRALGDGR